MMKLHHLVDEDPRAFDRALQPVTQPAVSGTQVQRQSAPSFRRSAWLADGKVWALEAMARPNTLAGMSGLTVKSDARVRRTNVL